MTERASDAAVQINENVEGGVLVTSENQVVSTARKDNKDI